VKPILAARIVSVPRFMKCVGIELTVGEVTSLPAQYLSWKNTVFILVWYLCLLLSSQRDGAVTALLPAVLLVREKVVIQSFSYKRKTSVDWLRKRIERTRMWKTAFELNIEGTKYSRDWARWLSQVLEDIRNRGKRWQ